MKNTKKYTRRPAASDAETKAAVKRVIAERDEVQTRLSKLCAFMGDKVFANRGFLKLSPANRILLERQRTVMQEYRDILDTRIELMIGGLSK